MTDVCGNDESFDHYARIVRRAIGVPVSLVSILEPRRQLFVGASGLPEPYASTRETPLSHSFCKHVVGENRPLVVSDARIDPVVLDNLAITDLDVVAYAGSPLVDESGQAVGSLCAIDSKPRTWSAEELGLLEDLARACSIELQQRHRQALATENLTYAIFESANVAMAFYDTDGLLVLANDLARRAADVAGIDLAVPPFTGAEVRAADNETPIPHDQQLIPRALRGEQVPPTMMWVGPPGRQIALKGSARPVSHSDGRPWGTLIAAHDITRLARALQTKDDFIGTVAHELRTPLMSIMGYLDLIEDELSPGPGNIADAMAAIQRNALDLQHRIGELVDAADRRRDLDLRSTDVTHLVNGVAASFDERARAAEVLLTVDADESHWAYIDPKRVEKALGHLISNAIKYTRASGHVRLGVSSSADAVRVVVADTGVGMTEDEVTQAFDLFWRAASTYRSATQGLGIGLTFVRDTVEAHGGSVHVNSDPGRGTTLTLTFARDNRARRPRSVRSQLTPRENA